MNLKKYKFKNRILLVETPKYQDKEYLKTKNIYETNLQEFHKRYIRLITTKNEKNKFKIKLIGFDGNIKNEFKKLNTKIIFKLIEKMPLNKLLEQDKRIKPTNLALYSDYILSSTIHGLGYGNKKKALHTIKTIKNKPINYQISTVNTMLGRAKNHKYQNKDMREAIKVFQKWLNKYKKSKKMKELKTKKNVKLKTKKNIIKNSKK